MRQLMEYKIISGRTVEIRRVMMEAGRHPETRRGIKVKGKTSLRKIQANERAAVKNLARILNCNFGQGDMWITLGYPDDQLPESKEEAKKHLAKFFRRVRAELKKSGKKLRYVATTSNVSTETGEVVRLHHHIVMDPVSYEAVCRLWPEDYVSYRRLDGRGDYTGIAKYMVRNANASNGEQRWTASRGLAKPVYTEPRPCKLHDGLYISRNMSIKEKNVFEDEETGAQSLYVRYTKPRREPGGGKQ